MNVVSSQSATVANVCTRMVGVMRKRASERVRRRLTKCGETDESVALLKKQRLDSRFGRRFWLHYSLNYHLSADL